MRRGHRRQHEHGRHGDAIGRVDRILAADRILANITYDRLRSSCWDPGIWESFGCSREGAGVGRERRGICPLCDFRRLWDLGLANFESSLSTRTRDDAIPQAKCVLDSRGRSGAHHDACGADKRCSRAVLLWVLADSMYLSRGILCCQQNQEMDCVLVSQIRHRLILSHAG